jgi:hypothetical protein
MNFFEEVVEIKREFEEGLLQEVWDDVQQDIQEEYVDSEPVFLYAETGFCVGDAVWERLNEIE